LPHARASATFTSATSDIKRRPVLRTLYTQPTPKGHLAAKSVIRTWRGQTPFGVSLLMGFGLAEQALEEPAQPD
jgi:hypothetical protein